ncbi:DUF3168 domain-containing protein [Dubosiella newyorkensis]|jgi:hypothetical protein|uniref:DUF3168 domain-containing protein n=1 Tax=Dubosiella newyorkensis TaxID=1862672 RepID=UPI00033D4DA9|nr:DUF3168 domain-containing protein [Dubosiella newyorkensis]EOS60906.1 hypothetical protein C815_00914 [Firmicutes bacterium M10-2]MCI9042257.1 DUF3168 domain-containing protein [Dubosiella newyorkensis]
MSPQQELFSQFRVALEKAFPGMVFDGDLPPEDTPYPFIYIGNTQDSASYQVKGGFFGRVNITIHAWTNNIRARGDFSSLLFGIRRIAQSIDASPSYGWCMSGGNEDILPDDTTSEPLMHGLVNCEYKYWRK